jgi:hypothetical protein
MSPFPRQRRAASPAALLSCLAALLLLAGCSSLVEARPTPTPLDFGGITAAFARAGITLSGTTSGDAGCPDPNLIPTAIAFDAAGVDLAAPAQVRIYIFADRAAWQRRLADVDTCVGAWATDDANVETIAESPYVVAGQGPWPPGFKAALVAALKEAAGNGD